MKTRRRAKKDGLLPHNQFIEVNRRAKLICGALDSGNDEKVEEIAGESIKILSPDELLILGSLVENHGFYNVGEAIYNKDLDFFGIDPDEL
jgi:hypothetical protein